MLAHASTHQTRCGNGHIGHISMNDLEFRRWYHYLATWTFDFDIMYVHISNVLQPEFLDIALSMLPTGGYMIFFS